MPDDTHELRYIQAVQRAQHWALSTRDDTILFGEDVGIPGGPFGSAKGLRDEFGPRVFDTPISESAILGAALGAAMRGLRPIVEIMYMDFMLVAMDPVVNQIPHTRYVSRGEWTAPLVIRTQQGYSPGACAQHSHSLEAVFAHTPGLRVGVPSTPRDAYEMLRAAVVSDDPVMIIESRMLYPTSGEVTLTGPVEGTQGHRKLRSGDDATVVAWARMAPESCAAADDIAGRIGATVEVIDPRWLNPLDLEPIVESVRRTGRLVVAHEANRTGGFGAEIAAAIAESCHADLVAPVRRVGAPDLPMPAAPALQGQVVPTATDVVAALESVLSLDQARARPGVAR